MGHIIRVSHRGGDRFEIAVRDHVWRVDQPIGDGGDDTAATPTEMFVASLVSCVAFFTRRYLERHGLDTEGLAVSAEFTMAPRPSRVGDIAINLEIPPSVPEDRREALLAVASHCTVHNSLADPPQVRIAYATPVASLD